MSRVDELIKKLCPNGVVFEEIGAVVEIKNGKDWKTERPGKIPVFGSGGQMDVYVQEASCVGPSVLLPRKGSLAVQFVDVPFWNVDTVFYTKCNPEQLDIKYFYYVMERVDLSRISTSSTRPSITQTALKKLVIPVPPLEIQHEIARILDKFTQLEAELEAELEARRKQYSFYKNALFSFGDDVKFHELGDICESITAGGDRPKRYCKGQTEPTDEFPYPIYSNGTGNTALYGYTDQFKISEPAVTISARGTIGAHSVRSACFTPIVRLLVLIPDSKLIDLKFLNYVLDVTEIGYSGGSIPQLTVPKVKRLRIPLPPLEEQRRIVAILDKFDALVNDISTGLPAEIAARRKQYEYYRDKLLSFEPV